MPLATSESAHGYVGIIPARINSSPVFERACTTKTASERSENVHKTCLQRHSFKFETTKNKISKSKNANIIKNRLMIDCVSSSSPANTGKFAPA